VAHGLAQGAQGPLARHLAAQERHRGGRLGRLKAFLRPVAELAHELDAVLLQHAPVELPELLDPLLVGERVEAAQRLPLLDGGVHPALVEAAQESPRQLGERRLTLHGGGERLGGEAGRGPRPHLLEGRPARREVEAAGQGADAVEDPGERRRFQVVRRPADPLAQLGEGPGRVRRRLPQRHGRGDVRPGPRGHLDRPPFQAVPHAERPHLDHPADVGVEVVPGRPLALPEAAEEPARRRVLARQGLALAPQGVGLPHVGGLLGQGCGLIARLAVAGPARLDLAVAAGEKAEEAPEAGGRPLDESGVRGVVPLQGLAGEPRLDMLAELPDLPAPFDDVERLGGRRIPGLALEDVEGGPRRAAEDVADRDRRPGLGESGDPRQGERRRGLGRAPGQSLELAGGVAQQVADRVEVVGGVEGAGRVAPRVDGRLADLARQPGERFEVAHRGVETLAGDVLDRSGVADAGGVEEHAEFAVGAERGEAEGAPGRMDRLDIGVQLLADRLEPAGLGLREDGTLQRRVERGAELLHHQPFVGAGRVQLQAELAEPGVGQPAVDDLERRHLLGHEEHRPAGGERLRDQVGDGLRLAGPRRPFEHHVVLAVDRGDGAELAGVGVDHLGARLGRVVGVKVERAHLLGEADRLRAVAGHEPPDEPVRGESRGVGLQVLVHHELLEREETEVDVGLDRPSGLGNDRFGHGAQEALEVVIRRDVGQVRQLRQLEAVEPAQVLGKRRVDHGVLVRRLEDIARLRRTPGERDRQQHEGRPEHLRILPLMPVVEHAERQEQRVDPLLFGRGARLLLDAAQRLVELLGAGRGLQQVVPVTVLELGGVVRGEVGGRPRRLLLDLGDLIEDRDRFPGRRLRRFGCLPLLRGRQEAHGLLQQIELLEDLRRLLVDDGDRRDLVDAEIERPVAPGEVQELPLPVVDRDGDALRYGVRRGGGGRAVRKRLRHG
jgi:hypothetical protein